MKKVLILAYDFPPYLSVGALRPYYWYRYFKDYGLYPVVVSRQWSQNLNGNEQYVSKGFSDEVVVSETEYGTLIQAPYKPNIANRMLLKYGESRFKFLRKFFTAFFEIGQWYFKTGPKIGIYNAALNYLKNNHVECIIATGDPFILFKYAAKISDKTGIPWIADYRDLWIETKHEYSWINNLLNIVYKRFEKRVLKNVSTVTTVADFIVKIIQQYNPQLEFNIVPNGYDSETILKYKDEPQDAQQFTLTYIGRIYADYPVTAVFGALNQFLSEGNIENFKFRLIGLSGHVNVKQWKSNYPVLFGKTEIIPSIETEMLMKELSRSNAFLLFNMHEIIGTKIYDYIAINRKIIFCFAGNYYNDYIKKLALDSRENELQIDYNVQEKFVVANNAGFVIKDEVHLQQVLNDLYQEFKISGKVLNEAKSINEFSRKNQSGKFAEIINNVIKSSANKLDK